MSKIILISGKARSGKDTSAQILKEIIENDGKKVLIAHYADLLKYICKTFFNWDGKKDEKGRTLLQKVGTETIRKQNPDYWVEFLAEFIAMFEDEWDYIIICDVRFPNEIETMKLYDYDVATLRVNRINFESDLTDEQKDHMSEIALDDYDFDCTINAITGIEDLTGQLKELYNKGVFK